jgi:hypothetical protein
MNSATGQQNNQMTNMMIALTAIFRALPITLRIAFNVNQLDFAGEIGALFCSVCSVACMIVSSVLWAMV